MGVQSHVLPARIVVDIVCTLADPSGINGWSKTGLGLDRPIDHCLGLLEITNSKGCDIRQLLEECPSRRSLSMRVS